MNLANSVSSQTTGTLCVTNDSMLSRRYVKGVK